MAAGVAASAAETRYVALVVLKGSCGVWLIVE